MSTWIQNIFYVQELNDQEHIVLGLYVFVNPLPDQYLFIILYKGTVFLLLLSLL